jgi:hypothetical protein
MPPSKTPLSMLSPASVAHNKGRIEARLAAPKPRGELGPASKWLSEKEKKIWRQLVKNAPAVLGESDRCLMEITVTLKAKLEDHSIENAQLTLLISCLTKLGMIPADRRPVEPPKKKDEDPFDEFTNAPKEA